MIKTETSIKKMIRKLYGGLVAMEYYEEKEGNYEVSLKYVAPRFKDNKIVFVEFLRIGKMILNKNFVFKEGNTPDEVTNEIRKRKEKEVITS
jgi:hypothetical protein